MGYAVYEDPEGHDRWAGYGVPAECDWTDCHAKIDRGIGCKCEDHGDYHLFLNGEEVAYDRYGDDPDAEEDWVEEPGCGLYFCEEHRTPTGLHDAEHTAVKPDTPEWVQHMLTDDSWAEWRAEHPELVGA